mgnify:CR=1 FL=1
MTNGEDKKIVTDSAAWAKGNAAAKGTPRFLFDLTRYFIPEIDVV